MIGPFERPVNVLFNAAACDFCHAMLGEPDPGPVPGLWAPTRIAGTLLSDKDARFHARYRLDNDLEEQRVRKLATEAGWRIFTDARGTERVICSRCAAEVTK